MKKRRITFLAIAGTAVVVMFLVTAMGALSSKDNNNTAAAAEPTKTIVIKDSGGFANAISEVAKELMPAVVHIDITGTMTQKAPEFNFPFGNDPFFKYFFGPQQQQRKVPIRALGSGIIISKDGYILTNNHVVEHADTIDVELYDGTKQPAKVIGKDPSTDLAVVKINPTPNMKYARLGDSDAVKVGQWVIAIGSPRGFDWTVTAGIISAKHRTGIGALGPTGYEDFIQTDASINPGNSGGPLIDLNGEVIGINSLIVSATRGSEGMGFAIPSNMAKEISKELIEHGKVVRGYMGVNIQNITPEMAKSLKLEKGTKGVIVANILPGSPADKAGIEQGDIINQYNGKNIEDVVQLRNMVAETSPGTTVKVGVLRDKKQIDLTIKIGDLEKEQKVAKAQAGSKTLGVTVEKVTRDTASKIGLSKPQGVIITEIVPNSPAGKVGLQKGDVIFRVNNTPVNDPKTFRSVISEAAKEGGAMLLVRDVRSGRIGYITVRFR
jgi:serine protease Do